jgi:hypothetical protein
MLLFRAAIPGIAAPATVCRGRFGYMRTVFDPPSLRGTPPPAGQGEQRDEK